MFVRFHTPWAQVRRGVHYGLFGPAYAATRSSRVPEVLRLAVRHELDWFEYHLPVPGRRAFCVKSRKVWRPDGICWFVDDAGEMIARAFALAALVRECGLPVSKVATRRPGQVLYRDAYQIVAKPDRATPTTWH
jgi:hypothetical protein